MDSYVLLNSFKHIISIKSSKAYSKKNNSVCKGSSFKIKFPIFVKVSTISLKISTSSEFSPPFELGSRDSRLRGRQIISPTGSTPCYQYGQVNPLQPVWAKGQVLQVTCKIYLSFLKFCIVWHPYSTVLSLLCTCLEQVFCSFLQRSMINLILWQLDYLYHPIQIYNFLPETMVLWNKCTTSKTILWKRMVSLEILLSCRLTVCLW